MIEGYSHHDGHADLMRERLDGSAGRTTDRPNPRPIQDAQIACRKIASARVSKRVKKPTGNCEGRQALHDVESIVGASVPFNGWRGDSTWSGRRQR
jgi:hypothetical protein